MVHHLGAPDKVPQQNAVVHLRLNLASILFTARKNSHQLPQKINGLWVESRLNFQAAAVGQSQPHPQSRARVRQLKIERPQNSLPSSTVALQLRKP
jgi:hypothetical protein